MRGLLFLGRVAFICNFFFILCLLMRHTHLTVPQAATEFVVITGWLMSVVFNLLFAVVAAVIFIRKKKLAITFWLFGFNLTCLLIQIGYRILFRD